MDYMDVVRESGKIYLVNDFRDNLRKVLRWYRFIHHSPFISRYHRFQLTMRVFL